VTLDASSDTGHLPFTNAQQARFRHSLDVPTVRHLHVTSVQ
jgi:hypothetical protein